MLAYSARNRSASIRIPYVSSPKGKFVLKLASRDPIANPYLAFSASMLMAGLSTALRTRFTLAMLLIRIYTTFQLKKPLLIPQVAGSLREALDELDKDREFLTAGGVFTDDVIDAYIELKMEEVYRVEHTTHPVEFDMYYSV